jgi:hypothetical protein
MRWKIFLPVVGLLLFAGVTVESLHRRRAYQKDPGRYLYWSSIQLDSDPLHRQPEVLAPCKDAEGGCASWDPIIVERVPGLLPGLLMLSAYPAFIVGLRLVRALGRHGLSEISSFMVVVPVLVAGWHYGIGWAVDYWIYKRRQNV